MVNSNDINDPANATKKPLDDYVDFIKKRKKKAKKLLQKSSLE